MFVYIAAPYTSTAPGEEMKRLEENSRYSAIEYYMVKVFNEGHIALSPVVHCRDLAHRHQMPTTYDFWQRYCEETLKLISKVDAEVHVLMLSGWEDSVGVAGEIVVAKQLEIPVKYILSST